MWENEPTSTKKTEVREITANLLNENISQSSDVCGDCMIVWENTEPVVHGRKVRLEPDSVYKSRGQETKQSTRASMYLNLPSVLCK